jgi:ABC-2 type transport system ATP-binding protein
VARVETLSHGEGTIHLRAFPKRGEAIAHPISQALRDVPWEVDELHVERGRLDEVFRSITTRQGLS